MSATTKSRRRGSGTSVEVEGIKEFPWFQGAKVNDVFRVEMPSPSHLYWPSLDVDLEVESLGHPEGFPLIYH